MQVKLIRSPADLIRLIEELKAAEKVPAQGSGTRLLAVRI